jgi:hypothetical protein
VIGQLFPAIARYAKKNAPSHAARQLILDVFSGTPHELRTDESKLSTQPMPLRREAQPAPSVFNGSVFSMVSVASSLQRQEDSRNNSAVEFGANQVLAQLNYLERTRVKRHTRINRRMESLRQHFLATRNDAQ